MNVMFKKFHLILLLIFALPLSACGDGDPVENPSKPETETPTNPSIPQVQSKDGKHEVRQTAKKGNGINLIFMGDGYTDKDIEAGTYDKDMNRFIEHTFALEPMKSLRDYFNVAVVYVASKNNSLDGNSGIKTSINDSAEQFYHTAEQVAEQESIIDKYAAAVKDGNSKTNTIYGVIANTQKSAGITHTPGRASGKCDDFRAYSLATKYNEYGYDEKITWIHEFVGHAFGKLDDEYGWKDSDTQSLQNYKAFLEVAHRAGWSLNVSASAQVGESPWADLVEHYKGENLGCYHGGNSWNTCNGAAVDLYNPSWDNFNDVYYNSPSIMGNTYASNVKFNAPCRRALYNLIIKLGEGREATLEEFLAFDSAQK